MVGDPAVVADESTGQAAEKDMRSYIPLALLTASTDRAEPTTGRAF